MTQEITGTLDISNKVLSDIVGYAALESYGIVGVADANNTDKVLSILPIPRLRRGININVEGNHVTVDIYVVVEYGTNISTVCDNLRDRIKFVLKEYAGIDDAEVNVLVKDVNVR